MITDTTRVVLITLQSRRRQVAEAQEIRDRARAVLRPLTKRVAGLARDVEHARLQARHVVSHAQQRAVRGRGQPKSPDPIIREFATLLAFKKNWSEDPRSKSTRNYFLPMVAYNQVN